MTCRGRVGALMGLLVLALGLPAQAQQRPDPNPDASIVIEQVRVGVLAVGASVGGGRLRFRGEEHSFAVRGLEFGSLGVASLSATGEVFNLRRLEDFSGRYEEHAAQAPSEGESGPTTYFLRNAAGVELRLRTERLGGQLRFAPGGVTIELR
ncbi:hypothetical protein [Falsiroseomonas oryzae]|uniref:hypothetical protein n=1 Tax=Falsiroseomonas oryzae TaxID=2766473 RepID=UPI0022EA114A|nr:hypothetical protein [Roseomonas sp. MO-31]